MKKKITKINFKPLVDKLLKKSEFGKIIGRIIRKYPKTYLVGGAVRDYILQRPFKDYDFVVEGVEKEELYNFLSKLPGKLVDIQSRNFGVFKYRSPGSKTIIDIALPRLDLYREYFLGHQDVETISHKNISISDDLSRRDFTINALAVNLSTYQLIDPFDGLNDLGLEEKKGQIKAVGDPYERLVKEDPTRMLRAIRFSSQLNFEIEKKTFSIIKNNHHQICATFLLSSKNGQKKVTRVAWEVLAAEFLKGFNANPSYMIELLDQSGVYKSILTPNLKKTWEGLKTTEQPYDYHAEGNVWNHTVLGLKNIPKLAFNKIGLPKDVSINVKLAILLHDFGKVSTFVLKENNYTYYNHPEVSKELCHEFIKHLKLTSPFAKTDKLHVDIKKVEFLVSKHMMPFNVKANEIKERKIIKYFLDDEIQGLELLQVCYLDASSAVKSGNKPPNFHSLEQFIKRIKEVKQKLVTPLNQAEIDIVITELKLPIYRDKIAKKNIKLLVQKIENCSILGQSEVDTINNILLAANSKKSNKDSHSKFQKILTKLINKKTPYPVSGDLLKELIIDIFPILKKNTTSSFMSSINFMINNPSGGKIIGELKEYFLQDRLDNPQMYFHFENEKNKIEFKNYLSKKLIQYFTPKI
ncbi:MAG: CCA tRNA nucleotidyltransferase [Patescibacteria group bacterium]